MQRPNLSNVTVYTYNLIVANNFGYLCYLRSVKILLHFKLKLLICFIVNGTAPDCCDSNGTTINTSNMSELAKVNCIPILFPKDDPVFSNRTCMNFIRSGTRLKLDCRPGPLNQVSWHWKLIMLVHQICLYLWQKLS